MSTINFDIQGIGKIINDHHLSVPIYQRPYAWEEKHIKDMLDDIENAIKDKEPEYFMGTIVLTETNGSQALEIIDGQQRITSVFIFLSVIRDFFRENGEENKANTIKSRFISELDLRDSIEKPKLNLGMQDDSYFQDLIINNDTPHKLKTSHSRIEAARTLSRKKVEKLTKTGGSDLEVLHNWIDYITDKLQVVKIIVPSEANAFTIFETLNDRGLELAQIDLLKNYLYSKLGGELTNIQNTWMEMVNIFEEYGDEGLMLQYIKHYWYANYEFTRVKHKELYDAIKRNIRNKKQVLGFIKDLKNNTHLYLAIVNHNHSHWKNYNDEVKGYAETLNFFKLEQYRPLLFAILKKFNDKEVEKAMKLMVSWLVRNLITGSLGGGTLELEYAKQAREIMKGKIKNTKKLRESLKDIIPSDNDFKTKFINARTSKEKYARYYLRSIENYNNKGVNNSPSELLVNSSSDDVNLEHILPKNPEKNWPKFSPEEVNEYKNRIGNLSLMQAISNSSHSNASFNIKKKQYKQSKLWITNMICDYAVWNTDNIIDRQTQLAEIAVEVWSL